VIGNVGSNPALAMFFLLSFCCCGFGRGGRNASGDINLTVLSCFSSLPSHHSPVAIFESLWYWFCQGCELLSLILLSRRASSSPISNSALTPSRAGRPLITLQLAASSRPSLCLRCTIRLFKRLLRSSISLSPKTLSTTLLQQQDSAFD
jgi:hypothetical protein